MDHLVSINPTTLKEINSYPIHTEAELRSRLEKSKKAWHEWRRTSFKERSTLLMKAASLLRKNSEELSLLMTHEMGKAIRESRSEIEKSAWVCEYYAENGEKFLTDERVEAEAQSSYVSFQPLGAVLAVMPWNFPFWQVFRFAAPALMAGNVALLKHASNVTGCSLAIEKIFQEAGFPKGVFQSLVIPSKDVAKVIASRVVRAVSLTGSTPAGKAVASEAGRHLKKVVLELGGSDPYLILEDADLEEAARLCVTSRLINSGQSCIAAKRFIVCKEVKSEFESLVVSEMKKRTLGDPTRELTDLGPMARVDLRDELHRQVEESVLKGARLLLGGAIPNFHGAYYPPTVLTDVSKGTLAYHEELFGPVATIIQAKSDKDAIEIANDTSFGLGAAVFTRDLSRGERIARTELQAGAVFVNSFVKSDPRLPFGGIKESGYGRELSGFGIREFVNIKTVCVY